MKVVKVHQRILVVQTTLHHMVRPFPPCIGFVAFVSNGRYGIDHNGILNTITALGVIVAIADSELFDRNRFRLKDVVPNHVQGDAPGMPIQTYNVGDRRNGKLLPSHLAIV
jgi:hypothetical protein